ncbi:MAG: Bug family tripartite tricarboxylate transporter substrate binding protein [Xanthobacteraceae bacterium]
MTGTRFATRDVSVLCSTLALLLPVVLLGLTGAHAQSDYPTRPVRIVVGFAAGGGNDIFARLVGLKLSGLIGHPVVVENRPGAGGRLAAEYVAHQAADGYTLLVGASGAMSIAAAIYPDLAYQPTKTFTPLAMIASFPLFMVIASDHPAKTVNDMVAWAKQHPDKANYATTSPAFTITTELLKLESGMPGIAIPYRSSTDMVLSVISGQTMTAIADGPPSVPMVKAGKVKAIAVTGAERSAELPDVPSMAESGFPAVDIHLWSGLFAPAATPPAIVAKLEKELREAIADPGVSEKLRAMAVDPGGGTPADFKRMIETDIVKYKDVVKAANLHFEE